MFKKGSPGARARTKIAGRVEGNSPDGTAGRQFCRPGRPSFLLVRGNQLCRVAKANAGFNSKLFSPRAYQEAVFTLLQDQSRQVDWVSDSFHSADRP
jgi:hypothetical protein